MACQNLGRQNLYLTWVSHARRQGLKVRMGPGKYQGIYGSTYRHTPLIVKKNEIFTEFRETYQLDSISGDWDFIEPALFGYAAGQVIENFCRFNLSPRLNVIAHFHEWMTAAGVLYLEKYTPHICTMFTTHATITGRCIASNYQPLYQNLGEYNGFVKAHEFNVTAKHSLEKIAARVADTFTTVSTITANECKYLLEKEVDIVTPNGFERDFVPHEIEIIEKRKIARNKIFDIVSALTNQQYDEDTLIVMNSGRYEFRNKGIDVFIDSIANIRNNKTTDKKIIALITVPANHGGFRQYLLDKFNSKE